MVVVTTLTMILNGSGGEGWWWWWKWWWRSWRGGHGDGRGYGNHSDREMYSRQRPQHARQYQVMKYLTKSQNKEVHLVGKLQIRCLGRLDSNASKGLMGQGEPIFMKGLSRWWTWLALVCMKRTGGIVCACVWGVHISCHSRHTHFYNCSIRHQKGRVQIVYGICTDLLLFKPKILRKERFYLYRQDIIKIIKERYLVICVIVFIYSTFINSFTHSNYFSWMLAKFLG